MYHNQDGIIPGKTFKKINQYNLSYEQTKMYILISIDAKESKHLTKSNIHF